MLRHNPLASNGDPRNDEGRVREGTVITVVVSKSPRSFQLQRRPATLGTSKLSRDSCFKVSCPSAPPCGAGTRAGADPTSQSPLRRIRSPARRAATLSLLGPRQAHRHGKAIHDVEELHLVDREFGRNCCTHRMRSNPHVRRTAGGGPSCRSPVTSDHVLALHDKELRKCLGLLSAQWSEELAWGLRWAQCSTSTSLIRSQDHLPPQAKSGGQGKTESSCREGLQRSCNGTKADC